MKSSNALAATLRGSGSRSINPMLVAASAVFALVLAASPALAVPITGTLGSGTDNLGSFEGTFEYSYTDDFNAIITITLENTSPTQGYITALAFNVPDGAEVDSATLDTSTPGFDEILGGSDFSDDVSAAPFGDFDIGAGTGGSWLGGGNPNDGIASGDSATFTFVLVGSGFSTLTPQSFLDAESSDPQGGGAQSLVVRFRGFDDGGSDKVPVSFDAPVPEPGTLLLMGAGLASLTARRIRNRRR